MSNFGQSPQEDINRLSQPSHPHWQHPPPGYMHLPSPHDASPYLPQGFINRPLVWFNPYTDQAYPTAQAWTAPTSVSQPFNQSVNQSFAQHQSTVPANQQFPTHHSRYHHQPQSSMPVSAHRSNLDSPIRPINSHSSHFSTSNSPIRPVNPVPTYRTSVDSPSRPVDPFSTHGSIPESPIRPVKQEPVVALNSPAPADPQMAMTTSSSSKIRGRPRSNLAPIRKPRTEEQRKKARHAARAYRARKAKEAEEAEEAEEAARAAEAARANDGSLVGPKLRQYCLNPRP